MITEDYVRFETAKLLKEKGFDIYGYASIKVFGGNTYEVNGEWITPKEDIIIPTLQMAMKWLREVHKIYVNVCPSVEGYYWTEKWHSYVENLEKRYPFGMFIGTFNSYEEACEAAIKYCLENLI